MTPKDWEFYTTASGHSPAAKEIGRAKLSQVESAQLARLMERISVGEVLHKDVKYIPRYRMHEARLDGDRRIFRLLYAERADGTRLIASLFTQKKAQTLPQKTFETAAKRIADWDSRDTTH